MRKVLNKLTLAALLFPILICSSCSEQTRAKYTWKNMLIGALIGVCIPAFFLALGLVFGGKKTNKNNDNSKNQKPPSQ